MTLIDERFLRHRLRSTSTAGIVSVVLAGVLWFYRYAFENRLEWDLFTIVMTAAIVKIGLMLYYRATD